MKGYVYEQEVHNILVHEQIMQAPKLGVHFVSFDDLLSINNLRNKKAFGVKKKVTIDW